MIIYTTVSMIAILNAHTTTSLKRYVYIMISMTVMLCVHIIDI